MVGASGFLVGCLTLAVAEVAVAEVTDPDTAAWVKRWRYGSYDRCRTPEDAKSCNWLKTAGRVDVGCRVEIAATGLAGGLAPEPPKAVFLHGGVWDVASRTWTAGGGSWRTFRARDAAGNASLENPSLCAYGLKTARQRGVVGLVVASSISYLFREWASFVNKAAYFEAAGLDWSLFVGDLDARLATRVSSLCAWRLNSTAIKRDNLQLKASDSLYVGDARRLNSNHLAKIIATYALLDRPGIAGVAYVDMDAMAPRPAILAAARRPPAAPVDAFVAVDPRDDKAKRLEKRAARWQAATPAVVAPDDAPNISWWSNIPDDGRAPPPAKTKKAKWWRITVSPLKSSPKAEEEARRRPRAFWQTKSMRYFVRAGDDVSYKILGRWMEHRCGFKDQLPLWHALLTVAGEAGCLDYKPSPRHPGVFGLDYSAARGYPDRTPRRQRPAPRDDPLLVTCADLEAKCPHLRICDQGTSLLEAFSHKTVATDRTREFDYVDDLGRHKSFAVPDNEAEAEDGATATLSTNVAFVDYFGLDLAAAH